MTYRDLIAASLEDLQIVAAGDTLSDDDAQIGVARLNDWIDALALEGLTIPALTRGFWPLMPGTVSYLVGTGATVNVPKPVSPQAIHNIGYVDTAITSNTEVLFGGVLTEEAYARIPQKALAQPYPTSFFYNPTVGLTGTLYPFPLPTVSTLMGLIYVPVTLTEVLLTDPVVLPAGYRRFFRSNLTVELAAAFEKPVPPSIVRAASESMMRVKAANTRLSDLGFDAALPGIW